MRQKAQSSGRKGEMSQTKAVSLGLAVLFSLTAASAALSTTPGANGLIVYAKAFRPGGFHLSTIHPDGSGVKRLPIPGSAANADWSPDGKSIVFGWETKNNAGIALISADGKGIRNLTPKGFQGQPSFSPDGKTIVYERDIAEGNNGVWIMRSDGTRLRRVTRSPFGCCDTDPNFAPNGKLISFVRVKQDGVAQALFVVRRDGSGLRQLTPYAWEVAIKHDWSPDANLILLTTNADFVRPNESANLVTIRPDGSGKTDLTRFTRGTKNAFAGSFSPDGEQIVFRLEEGDTYSLAVMNRDGGEITRLTTGKSPPRFIDWGTHP
jgi:Tol biopolymer transport system component